MRGCMRMRTSLTRRIRGVTATLRSATTGAGRGAILLLLLFAFVGFFLLPGLGNGVQDTLGCVLRRIFPVDVCCIPSMVEGDTEELKMVDQLLPGIVQGLDKIRDNANCTRVVGRKIQCTKKGNCLFLIDQRGKNSRSLLHNCLLFSARGFGHGLIFGMSPSTISLGFPLLSSDGARRSRGRKPRTDRTWTARQWFGQERPEVAQLLLLLVLPL